jgi:glycine C-acetyltransferase
MIVVKGRQGPQSETVGSDVIMLGSNDYLGLAGDDDVIRGGIHAMQTHGTGLAMNQPFATTPLHERLRAKVAAFYGTEAALLFGSCTAANIAVLTTLSAEADAAIFSDMNNHASIIDGCRLARARTYVYRTRDPEDLQCRIEHALPGGRTTIISDGVFSVEGNIAPGEDLARIAARNGANLVLDESHAAGVIGRSGRGTAEACGLDAKSDVAAFTGTFAKAFGAGGGGYIAGPGNLLDEVKRVARFYIFNTGMHVAAVGAALVGIERAQFDEERRAALRFNVQHLRSVLTDAGFRLLGGDTPIVPVLIGDEEKAQALSGLAATRGVMAPAMTFPIVPRGSARLRLQPSAKHTAQTLERACEILAEEARKLEIVVQP